MNRNDDRVIEGLKSQAALRRTEFADAQRLGWKSGFGTKVAMEAVGIQQPLVGFLTKASQVDSGDSVLVGDWTNPLFEAEVAVRIASELGPGASAAEAAAAIGGIAAAIELVDLTPVNGVEEILAGNIFHRRVALGEFTPCEPDTLQGIELLASINGEPAEPVDPRVLIGEIPLVIAALADQLDLIGEAMSKNDVVITGAAIPPSPILPGQQLEVSLSNGSRVSLQSR